MGKKDLKVGTLPAWAGDAIYLPKEIHRQAIYVVGLSRTGKSTFLGNLALQFNAMGEGVLVIDHKDGLLARDLAMRADLDKLVYVAPGTTYFDGKAYHWGLNIMEKTSTHRPDLSQSIENVLAMFERLNRMTEQNTNIFANLDHVGRVVMREDEPTLLLVRRAITDSAYRKYLIMKYERDDSLEESIDHLRFLDTARGAATTGPTVHRLKLLLTAPELRYMLIQARTTLRLREWLTAGKMVVVDCVSGVPGKIGLTGGNSRFFANLVMTQAMNFAFTRVVDHRDETWRGQNRAVRFIVDEFDQLAAGNFPDLISKTGSFRVLPVMAHQVARQLGEDTLLRSEVRACPIQVYLTRSPEDLPRGSDMSKQPQKYEADLMLLNNSLPYGLVDRGVPRRIKLSNWLSPRNEAQLEEAMKAPLDNGWVTPESQLRERMKSVDEQATATTKTADQGGKAEQKAKRSSRKKSGGDGVWDRDSDGSDVPISEADRSADRQTGIPIRPPNRKRRAQGGL